MNIDEIREIVARAAELRVPRPGEAPAAEKASQLEDFMLSAAYSRGDLEQARIDLDDALSGLRGRWEAIEGWEMAAGSRPSKDDIRRAKARIDPTLSEALQEAERMLAQIDRQVRRLERDEATASRAYSLMTGG